MDPQPTLRSLAANSKRYVGVALMPELLSEPRLSQLAAQQFNSLTPEIHMKWDTVEPEPGQFHFEPGDQLVAFAERHGMRVRGHTLVWHNQLAPWVSALQGGALGAALQRHVRTTAAHWRGKLAQWDVVNEAVGADGALRSDSPFTALGYDYIAEAFRAAHEADPAAALYYNDYDIEDPAKPKAEGAYELVRRLKADGVPIHGMGFQMHVDPRDWPSPQRIKENLERYAALGLQLEITELDVPLGELAGDLQQKLAEQARLAHDIIAACLSVPACRGITFWGISDHHSWLNLPLYSAQRGRGPHLPLLFDADYRPKPMFERALAAFAAQ